MTGLLGSVQTVVASSMIGLNEEKLVLGSKEKLVLAIAMVEPLWVV